MKATAADFQTLIEYPGANGGIGYRLNYGGGLYRSQIDKDDEHGFDFDFGQYFGVINYQTPKIRRHFYADFYGALIRETQDDMMGRSTALLTLDLGDTVTASLSMQGGSADGTAFTASNLQLLSGGGTIYMQLGFVEGLYRYNLTIYIRYIPVIFYPKRILSAR